MMKIKNKKPLRYTKSGPLISEDHWIGGLVLHEYINLKNQSYISSE